MQRYRPDPITPALTAAKERLECSEDFKLDSIDVSTRHARQDAVEPIERRSNAKRKRL
jgi:hypothetical protein